MAITFNNRRTASETIGDSGQSINAYFYDDSAGTYTARSMTAAADLFSDTAAVNDSLIFKISYGNTKVQGIRFNISTAIVSASHTIVWEYQTGDGTWAAFSGVTDGTSGFTVTGVNDVTWTMPTDWRGNATAVNGSTGCYFFRARLSAVTTLTEGGRHNALIEFYSWAVRVDSNHEYDSGTATSGSSITVINDTTKAWTVNSMRNRLIWIHTGTNSRVLRVIGNNTATSITVKHPYPVAIDTTSQYTILANFEDIYQADVSGGWGVVSKLGQHTYSLNCWLDIKAASFGDLMVNVEFENEFFFFQSQAATSRYPLAFGWRLPPEYGLDKTLYGCTFVTTRESFQDNRALGFPATTSYAFSHGNKYILRDNANYQDASSNLRNWFFNYSQASIGDTYEGWRSVTFPRSSTPTEVRAVTVADGHSGIEQARAFFDNTRTFFNRSLGLFITGSSQINTNKVEFGLNNTRQASTAFLRTVIQYFSFTGTAYIDSPQKLNSVPTDDAYAATSTGRTYKRHRLFANIYDEKGNPLPNAKIEVTDDFSRNGKNYLRFDGVDDFVSAPNDSSNNAFNGCTAFSVEAWVRGASTGEGGNGEIVSKGISSGVGYALRMSGSSLQMILYTSTGLKTSNSVSYSQYAWQHVVGVYDGSTVQLYVDTRTGTAVSATGTTTNDTATDLFIGNRSTNDRTYAGNIRRVRLFRNKALTSQEVATLFNEGDFIQNETCPVSGCTAEYNFTDGTGTTLTDSVGTSDGTISGAIWIDELAGYSGNSYSYFTGTESNILSNQAISADSSFVTYSVTSQPSEPTRLRVALTNYSDRQTSGSLNSYIFIAGTDEADFSIKEAIAFEFIGNREYITKNEFKTITGIEVIGMQGTLTIDTLGIAPAKKVITEAWKSTDDILLDRTVYNPITVKVKRPGYETMTFKHNFEDDKDWVIALKRSSLDLI